MRIIFLDIDGVLVVGDDPACFKDMALIDGEHLHHFHRSCVDALNHITDTTGAKLVMSSTWRGSHNFEVLKKHLIAEGVTGELIDKTPILRDREAFSVDRGIEIQCWLSRHDHEDIESFVILDDDGDMAHLISKLVKTCFRDWDKTGKETGLTMEHAKEAIKLLEVENVPNN